MAVDTAGDLPARRGGSDASTWGATTAWVMVALLATSIDPVIIKMGYQSGASAVQMFFVRTLVGAGAVLALLRRWGRLECRDVGAIAEASALFMATYGLTFFALHHLSAVEVITITTTTPAMVAMVNHRRGLERISPAFLLGFILCLVGVLLTIRIHETTMVSLSLPGLMAAGGAVLGSTAYRTRMDSLLARVEPMVVSTWLFIANAVFALGLLPWVGSIPSSAWTLGGWMGLAGAVANVAFLASIHLLGSTRMSVVAMLTRPLAIVATALLLREPLDLMQGAGIVLVLLGVHFARVRRLTDGKREEQRLDTLMQMR